MSRPNILFLFTDQQAAGALSCTGNPHLSTPHMDRLAAGGMRFAQAYCAAPVCGPSRSSLASGCMPSETGVLVNGMSPDESLANMGQVFGRAGYQTAWSGRWHLPDNPGRGGVMRGFEALHDPAVRLGLGSAGDGPVTEAAVQFLQRRHDRPFLLGVSLCNPHDICHWIMDPPAPPATAEGLPPLPANFAVDPDEPEFIQQCRRRTYYGQEGTRTRDWDEIQWRAYLAAYYRYTEEVDRHIGRLLDTLRQCGLEENTLVVFTSDHGEGLAAHRWVVKLMLYEEPMRVPFMVRWPGVVAAGAVDQQRLVSGIDVLPTLCDYAGVECPPVTGQSLKPLIEDPAAVGRALLVAQLCPDTEDLDMQGRMLRTQRYKYIVFSRGRNPELFFDLQADPGETRNRVRDLALAGEVQRHRALLDNWCVQHGDSFRRPV